LVLSHPSDRTKFVSRTLAETIVQERPRIVACAAPAGCGKSVLAGQIAGRYTSTFTCDAGGDPIAFARAVITGLIEEDPTRHADLTAEILRLPADPAAWIDAARSAWGASTTPAPVAIFDRVDMLDENAARLLRTLLSEPGKRELIVLCSRKSVAHVLPRDLPPSAIFTLTERDFRFLPGETATFFGGELDAPTIARIDRIAHGWPLALDVLRRGHRRGLLARLLEDIHDVEYSGLDPYLEDEILAGTSEPELDMLLALSVLGEPSVAEFREALPLWLAAHTDRIATLPFVRPEGDRLVLQPVFAAFLARTRAERRRVVARGIAHALVNRRANWIRGSAIALDVGDTDYAAELFQKRRAANMATSPDAAALVERFDRETLTRHPGLWVSTFIYRMFDLSVDEWLAEANEVWNALPRETPPETLAGVTGIIIALSILRGDGEHLDAIWPALEARLDPAHAGHPLVRVASALLENGARAMRMQPVDLIAFMRDISPLLEADHAYALVLGEIIARVHIARGDRDAQRQALDEAVLRARVSGAQPILAMCLQESATMAWLAGEDLLFEMYTEELEQLAAAAPRLKRGVGHFLDCARGRGSSAKAGTEAPAARALSWLIAAGTTSVPGERRSLLDRAIRTADMCRSPHAMIVSRVAVASALPAANARWTEAEEIAATVNPVFWQHLVAQHTESERSRTFISRFAAEHPRESQVMVRILEGTVETEGKKIQISPKEFQLFALLAMSDAPLDAEVLCEALWPGTTFDRGAASLRVYVSRARRKLGDARCIEIDHGRYRAATFVQTDIEQISASIRRVPARPTHADVTNALRRWFSLVAGPPAFLLDLPAFSTLNATINDLMDRLEAWLIAVRERAHESDRQRITLALEAVAASS